MRLADRLIGRHWHFPLGIDEQRPFVESVAESVRTHPVLVADNVARYVDDRGECDLADFPSLAPPWPEFWIEYPSTSGKQRRGVWVVDATEMEGAHAHFGDLAEEASRHPLKPERVGSHRWVVVFTLFVEAIERGRSVWGPLGISALTLDDDGAPIGCSWSTAPMLQIAETAREISRSEIDPLSPDAPQPLSLAEIAALSENEARELYDRVRDHQDELNRHLQALDGRLSDLQESREALAAVMTLSDGERLDDAWIHRSLAPAYQAVAFLHCKNVETEEISPPAKVQAKRRRKGNEPLVRYHTLRLDVPRKVNGSVGGPGDGHKALHIVAGHFSHYGACCSNHEPHGLLFGRYEGIYWTPTHARGNQTLGAVRTDFDLRVPS